MDNEEKVNLITRIKVVGVPLHVVREENFERVVEELVARDALKQVMLVGLWDVLRSFWNRRLRDAMERAVLVIPVSRALIFGAQFQQKRLPTRYHAFPFVIRLLSALETHGRSVYLLGAPASGIAVAERNIRSTFPGLRIVGRYSGFYPSARESDIVTAINKAAPDFVLLGSGLPGKEGWVRAHGSELRGGMYLWHAQVFDVLAERANRRPEKVVEQIPGVVTDLITHPWRVLRAPVYAVYPVLLLYHRLRKL